MKKLYDSLAKDLKKRFSEVRLLVLDFDGTLTDNKVYTDQHGVESVRADRGDGLGLEFVRKYAKIDVIILSKETNPVTAARAKKLNIECVRRLDSKVASFEDAIAKRGLSAPIVCYIGNDLNDIPCMKKAGLAIAVADAYPQIIKAAHYVTKHKGGDGAVREVCEFIMYAKNVHPYP